jgi:hypothetical protein
MVLDWSNQASTYIRAALEIMYGVPPLDLFIQNCAQNAAIRKKKQTPPGNHRQKPGPELLMVDTFNISSQQVYGKLTQMKSPIKRSGKRTILSNSPQKRLTCYPAAT